MSKYMLLQTELAEVPFDFSAPILQDSEPANEISLQA